MTSSFPCRRYLAASILYMFSYDGTYIRSFCKLIYMDDEPCFVSLPVVCNSANAPQSMHFRPGHILVATMICTQETANAARPPKAVRKFHRMVPDQANRCCQVCTFCEKHGCCLGASQGRPNSVTCSWGRHICSTCYADHLFRRPQPASGSDEENGDVEGTHYRNSVENGAD